MQMHMLELGFDVATTFSISLGNSANPTETTVQCE